MKSVLFLMITLFFSNAYAIVQCKSSDTDLLKWAESRQKSALERFEVGLVAITDVQESNAFLLEVKYCLGQIDKTTFCKDGLAASKIKLQVVEAGYEVGTRTIADAINARSSVSEIEKICVQ